MYIISIVKKTLFWIGLSIIHKGPIQHCWAESITKHFTNIFFSFNFSALHMQIKMYEQIWIFPIIAR